VADQKPKTKFQTAEVEADTAAPKPSLGQIFTEARERKSLTREQVADEAHLPPHYVKMIETDSYDMISDRLYLVPFLRRYASFLGLDAEEIASRFVSDVQHAEANVVRISQEITMVARRGCGGSRTAFAVLIVAVVLLLADFAWRRFGEREARVPAPIASPAAMATAREPDAQAPNENLPPATVVSNPQAPAPAAAPRAAANAQRPASLPPADNRSAQPQQLPREATDD
jgi:cytoskeleton protein RodZ